MNGLHLLALLAGIYLMIFVMEPVAVPQHFLSQHYFGIPWTPERRTNSLSTQLPTTLQLIEEKVSLPAPNMINDTEYKQLPIALHRKNHSDVELHSPYRFLLSNYSQNPLSLQAAQTKKQASPLQTVPRRQFSNKSNVRHWHYWSVENAPDKTQKEEKNMQWSPVSGVVRQRDTVISSNRMKEKIFNATGSAKSVDLK